MAFVGHVADNISQNNMAELKSADAADCAIETLVYAVNTLSADLSRKPPPEIQQKAEEFASCAAKVLAYMMDLAKVVTEKPAGRSAPARQPSKLFRGGFPPGPRFSSTGRRIPSSKERERKRKKKWEPMERDIFFFTTRKVKTFFED